MTVLKARLLESAGFHHGFSTAPVDFALLRDAAALRNAHAALGCEVGFDPVRLYQTRQVHGREVVIARGDRVAFEAREADALVAEAESGNTVGVRVADCVPVLLASSRTGAVAAVHAGWRGIEAGILEAAAKAIDADLAAVGPSIGPCCFQVGHEVAARLAKAAGARVEVVERVVGDKSFVDLRRAARAQLRAANMQDARIEDVPGCTRCDLRFHSYRRDGDASGRLIAVIRAA